MQKENRVSTAVPKKSTAVNDEVHCPKHNNLILKLYCGFCEKPVCERCKTTTHAPHLPEIKGYEELIMAAKRRQDFIEKLSSDRTKLVIPIIKDKIFELAENKSKLVNRATDVIRQYKTYTINHRDKLKLPEAEWIEQLRHQSLNFQNTLEEKISHLKEMLLDVQSTFSYITEELEASSYPEVLFKFGAWRSKLEFLLPPKWPRMEICVNLKLAAIPDFGAVYFQNQQTQDKNCKVEFVNKIVEPLVYTRIFDTKLLIPKATFKEENARISIASAEEVFVSFGEYIFVYTQDNRRKSNARYNIRCARVVSVGENVLDLSCDRCGNVFYLTQNSVNTLDAQNKLTKCFSLYEIPSAICVTNKGSVQGPVDILVGFHDAGMLCKYYVTGDLKMKVIHPDSRKIYRPRHITLNVVNDIVFSDDQYNVTILDANGIRKGIIGHDVKTGNGHLRPSGIACASQRHVYVIDSNITTQLQIFDEDGNYLQTAVFNNLKDAYVLNIDRTCDVWIAFKDGSVRVYRPECLQ